MSNEKQTDPSYWRNRLDELEAIPGEEAFNKKAAWEMLDKRLQEKPRRIKAIWYWAAACLLLFVLIPMLRKTNDVVSAGEIPDLKHPPTIPVTTNHATDKTERAVKPVGTEGQTGLITSSGSGLRYRPDTSSGSELAYRPDTSSGSDLRYRPDTNSGSELAYRPDTNSGSGLRYGPDADTAIAKIVSVPVKKKLPVVHINELDKHDQENAQFATHGQWRVFQVKFLNQDNVAVPSLPSPSSNTQPDVFKLKIPLKN